MCLYFQMHTAIHQMSACPFPWAWATPVCPPSTTPYRPAQSSRCRLATRQATVCRTKTMLHQAITCLTASDPMGPRRWKALALRSLPTASIRKMRWRRAAARTKSSNGALTPLWRWHCPMLMATVTPAASALQAAFHHAAVTLRHLLMSPASITTTTPHRTPPGSLPVFLPRRPLSCLVHLQLARPLPLTIHHPPPLRLGLWPRKAGLHNLVAPDLTLLLAAGEAWAPWGSENTALKAPPIITHHAHPSSLLSHPRMALPGSASQMRAGSAAPTSTPTLLLWLPSMPWQQTGW